MDSTAGLSPQPRSAPLARFRNALLARSRNAGVAAGCRFTLGGLRGLIREAGSFGLIGIANAVIDMVLFTALHAGAGAGPLSAKIVSGLLTTIASYFANRRWTWPHRAAADAQRRQLLQFTGISAVGLAVAEACLGVSHYLLGLHSLTADNLSANVVGLGLGFVWRFYASRRWVFAVDRGATPAAPSIVGFHSWSVPQEYEQWVNTAPLHVSLHELLTADTVSGDHSHDTQRIA